MSLQAVPSGTTDPHVSVDDIDLSFRDIWSKAERQALVSLSEQLDGDWRIAHVWNYLTHPVDGWHAGAGTGNDGYILARVRRRWGRRQTQALLRLTGFKTTFDKRPTAIECLLYEPDHTELAREMLAGLGRELGVAYDLKVVRTTRGYVDDWRWLGYFGKS